MFIAVSGGGGKRRITLYFFKLLQALPYFKTCFMFWEYQVLQVFSDNFSWPFAPSIHRTAFDNSLPNNSFKHSTGIRKIHDLKLTCSFGMHSSLRNSFSVKVCHLISENHILNKERASWTHRHDI